MVQWEYRKLRISVVDFARSDDKLNEAGLAGWELVNAVGPLEGFGVFYFLMKRPIN